MSARYMSLLRNGCVVFLLVSLSVKRGKMYILVRNKYCGEHKKEKTGWRSSFQGEPGAVLSEGTGNSVPSVYIVKRSQWRRRHMANKHTSGQISPAADDELLCLTDCTSNSSCTEFYLENDILMTWSAQKLLSLRTVGCLQLVVYVTAGRPHRVECHNANVTRGRKKSEDRNKISLRLKPFVVQRCLDSKLMFSLKKRPLLFLTVIMKSQRRTSALSWEGR